MTRTGAMLVLASCAIVASAARGQAVRRAASVELTGEAAHVLHARTPMGAIAELRGRMTIRFSGPHASIRLPSGLTARARTHDVTLTLREDVTVSTASTRSPASLTLRRGAHVETESIDVRGALVRVATLSVTVWSMRVQASALHLDAVETAPVRPIECRVGYAPGYPRERSLRLDARPSRHAGGPALPAQIGRGAAVTEHVTTSGWSLVSTHETGIEILGWIRETSLDEGRTRGPAGAGGGLGEGRIGLSLCESHAQSATITSRTALEDAHGHTLVWLEVGDQVEVAHGPTDRLVVLGLVGVRRVGRCATPLGWIVATAIDPTALAPIVSGPPPLASAADGTAVLSTRAPHFVSIQE